MYRPWMRRNWGWGYHHPFYGWGRHLGWRRRYRRWL